MGNKLPDHIKVRKECVILELGEILPVLQHTLCFVM